MDTSRPARVYTAGPAVFFPDLAGRIADVHRLASERGLEVIVPGDVLDRPSGFPTAPTMRDIYGLNVQRILRADAMIADLVPFRGPSADPGTVFEIGYAVALGKPVFGYTADRREYKDRVIEDGLRVEDHGAVDNLMIGASITSLHDDQAGALEAVAAWWEGRAAARP